MLSRLLRVALVPLVLAACDDDETGPENERFTATLTGSAERPDPRTTPATGTAEFEVQDDGTVTYTVDVTGLANVFAGHIHGPADASGSAGVLVGLFPVAGQNPPTGTFSGTLVESSFGTGQITAAGVSMDSLLTLMRNGNAYVNLHTNDNVAPTNTGPGDFPGGEIRGQITVR